MKRNRYLASLSSDVLRHLKIWSDQLLQTRKRRKITILVVSNDLDIDRRIVTAVEEGSPNVPVGAYAALQNYYGFRHELEQLAAPWNKSTSPTPGVSNGGQGHPHSLKVAE